MKRLAGTTLPLLLLMPLLALAATAAFGQQPGSLADRIQTIIDRPVQTAECPTRAAGAPAVEVAVQPSAIGSYRKPWLSRAPPGWEHSQW